ncbi:AAA family ATPase [Candidatus Babeliales bacterium]|nr:AAA family ATPase [Candidatus Babeliales bacterium]
MNTQFRTLFLCCMGITLFPANDTDITLPETQEITAQKRATQPITEQDCAATILFYDDLFRDATPEAILTILAQLQDPSEAVNIGISQDDINQLIRFLPHVALKKHGARQLHALSSYLDELAMVITHKSIGLSQAQLKTITKHIGDLREHINAQQKLIVQCTPENIIELFSFTEQVTLFLAKECQTGFKKKATFTLKKIATRSRDSVFDNVEGVIKKSRIRFQEFEDAMRDLGMTHTQKFVRKFQKWNGNWNLLSKLEIGGLLTLAASLGRYFLKAPTAVNHQNHAIIDQYPNQPDSLYKLLPRGVQWYDKTIIGRQPSRINPERGGTESWAHEGLFGAIHAKSPSLITFVAFAAMLKNEFVNRLVDGLNMWKGLYRNPRNYFRTSEIFNDERKSVDAVEEVFISRIIEIAQPRITFDDVVGLEEQKRELQGIIQYLLNPTAYDRKGTSVEKGCILYGPTRTGKTYLAEALAGEILYKYNGSVSFLKINSAELRIWGIDKALEVIKRHAPCIVFIDEIDLLNLQRGNNSNLLEQFLTQLRSYEHDRIVFLAATNRIDHIDNALLQPGRFGKIIPFENPSFVERQEFFIQQLRKRGIEVTNINFERVAYETEGCSFGQLASIINDALTTATQEREMLHQDHFTKSIDAFKHKIVVPTTYDVPIEEQRVMSAHLAGHALTHILLDTGNIIHKVTMLPIQKDIKERQVWMDNAGSVGKKITTFGDIFLLHKTNSSGIDTMEEKENQVKALLAGHAAEKVLLGASSYDYHREDVEQAQKVLEPLIYRGMHKENLSKSVLDQKCTELLQLIDRYAEEVTHLLEEHKEDLERLANALQKQKTLTLGDTVQLLPHLFQELQSASMTPPSKA